VAAGRLDLDAPVTRYLPGFTVHSAFEQHPERKMTLRMLLSHTAGFTHEAPVGNNNDLNSGTFDAHVRSISETWLRFPVGTGYAYSNLGIDLAGYILERVDGRPFSQIAADSLLRTLGMDHSTFDKAVIRSSDNRAVGHVEPYPAPPVDVPMTAAGGLYASVADLARFLRFQLGDGTLDGRVVLGSRWMEEMRTVPPPHAGAPAGYALGVARTRWNRFPQRPDLFDHGGGGFGFLSDLWWLPQLHVGVAVLTNSQDHQLQGDLALSILGDLVTEPGAYRDRLALLPDRPPAVDSGSFEPPAGMATLVARAAMAPDGREATRWGRYTGLYRIPAWDLIDPVGLPDRFGVEAGHPYFDAADDGDPLVRHPLVEVEPGLFLASNGEALDLREPGARTWGNLRIVPVAGSPSGWQRALLGAAAITAASWLFAAATRVRRRRQASSASAREPAPRRRWPGAAGVVATCTALLALGTVVLLTALPGLVDSGFLGRLALPMAMRLVLHLPLALAITSVCTAAFVTWGWLAGWWPRNVLLQYAALAVTAVTLATQLAGWHLIGWGFI
jgi:CubicO group peptidase (beta-lactamase class C family)